MRKIRQLTISIKLKLWRLLTIINWVLWKLWYRFLSEISRSDVPVSYTHLLEEPDFLSGDIKDIKVADPKPDEEPKKEIPVQPEIEEAERCV